MPRPRSTSSSRGRAVLLLLALAGCHGAPAAPGGPLKTSLAWPDAAAGVTDPALAGLCTDLWEALLAADPIWAGRLGDARYLGALPDATPSGQRRERERLVGLQRRADALDPDALSAADRETLELLRDELQGRLIGLDSRLDEWTVDPLEGPPLRLFALAPDQPTHTAEQRAALLQRWAAMPAYLDACSARLRRGLADGRVACAHAVVLAIAQLQRLIDQPVDEWPLANPPIDNTLAAFERRVLLESARSMLTKHVLPALVRYRDVLENQVLPRARDDDHPGLAALTDGPTLYEQLVLMHTGLPLTAAELRDFGLAEIARIRAETAALSARVFGEGAAAGLPEGEERTDRLVCQAQERLRHDPALHFASREEVEDAASDALSRAQAAVPAVFGRLPRTPCVVVRVPAAEEQETTIAYYRGPASDGSLPGRYFINTFAPETRPRYDAEVLAFHEAVPGHHLQIALAQETEGLPRFRRETGSTAYVEGWALYTERLADELGLYSSDLDRLGMLSFDAWRACRLVVDTGLHAYGWTRQQAIDYMTANPLLAENNVENEVDRYIVWPGQAVAYKVGQREIVALREEARAKLGQTFTLPAFHDVVLGSGAVTLRVLRANVEEWVGAAQLR
ncbi:MAG TPA: DUF885 domain-containing protein [Planctomycetota bacterium]|nr:DUF885 domain-containing protein [Planctomycetota bacterium]